MISHQLCKFVISGIRSRKYSTSSLTLPTFGIQVPPALAGGGSWCVHVCKTNVSLQDRAGSCPCWLCKHQADTSVCPEKHVWDLPCPALCSGDVASSAALGLERLWKMQLSKSICKCADCKVLRGASRKLVELLWPDGFPCPVFQTGRAGVVQPRENSGESFQHLPCT